MVEILPIAATAAFTLIVTIAAAIVGAVLQSRREQEKWLREKRFEVAKDFLLVLYDHDFRQKIGTELRSELAAPADYFAQFRVLGMDSVGRRAEAAFAAVLPLQAMTEAEGDFTTERYDALQAKLDDSIEEYVSAVHKTLATPLK